MFVSSVLQKPRLTPFGRQCSKRRLAPWASGYKSLNRPGIVVAVASR